MRGQGPSRPVSASPVGFTFFQTSWLMFRGFGKQNGMLSNSPLYVTNPFLPSSACTALSAKFPLPCFPSSGIAYHPTQHLQSPSKTGVLRSVQLLPGGCCVTTLGKPHTRSLGIYFLNHTGLVASISTTR